MDLDEKELEAITVPVLTETMVDCAKQKIAEHARNTDEFEVFMAMVAPDLWRCGYCNTFYPVQSLARSCEARHEREEA